ncbi:hypothetical protein KC723_00255 [Candidatus Kaiserbacteria bacterium]|nr:hypothetical protein [Candidatus Kaiserbacteria bacterium]
MSFKLYLKNVAKQTEMILKTKYGLWLLAVISFFESALLAPIITDPFMIIYMLANRTRAVAAVVVTVGSSVFGGFIAYLLATSFYFFVTQYFSPEALAELDNVIIQFQDGTFWITIFGAITPVPYTLVALGAGFVQGNIVVFLLASIIGRSIRYGVVGYVTYYFGPQMLEQIEKRLQLFTIISVILVILYFIYYFLY